MGKASRLKQQRREHSERPHDRPAGGSAGQGRALLALLTHEPFQPIRLSWAIPGREAVLKKLVQLDCVNIDPAERACWVWMFHGESAGLRIGDGYNAVPVERRPLVLGRIRLPRDSLMTLDTNSTLRALEAARFFAVHLRSDSTLIRVRMVNRLFAGEEGRNAGLPELMKLLDQNVDIRDPREAEERLRREVQAQGGQGKDALRRALEARHRSAMESADDVPLVEDFPLAPEEETPDFEHLTMTLTLRLIRALECWHGRPLTLAQLITGIVTGELDVPGAAALRDILVRQALSVLG